MIAELTKLALDNLNKSVPDPELRAKLTPSYSIGCKRVLGSDRYYQALQKGNVELIASAVSQVSADGTITAADGSTAADVDAIILATGFDVAASLQFKTLTVKGLDGKDLCKTLAEDPYGTYLGLAVSGFPNMFVLMGPNTWLGHNSVLFMIECGVKLIMKFIKEMKRSTGKLQWWEVDQSAQQRFSREAQARLQGSVWLSGGCSSWYLPKEDGLTSKVTVHAAGHADDLSAADQDTGMSDVTAVPKPSRRADSQQQSCVMWMGTCVEYWWRTLWPRRGDWASVLG
jgi:cation diffusion facilitator CzcD-associated flavoprotein CzcO